MDKEVENVIVCGIALGLAVLGWAVSRKWGRKDWQKGAAVIAAAACLGLLSGYMELQTDEDPEKGLLRRENGEGDYEADLRMYVDGAKKAKAYTVHVPEQELTKQEEQAYLRAAEEELIKEFPGDNESVNCIRDAVVIREEYQEGHVEAEWSFDNYRLIESRTGRIVGEPDEEGELVNVQVTLTCGKFRCVQEFYICVYPRLLDEEERFRKGISEKIARQQPEAGADRLFLPDEVEGHTIHWEQRRDQRPEKILILGVIFACFVPVVSMSRKQEEQKKRKILLELEYPDLVSKLALLLGAGMTLQGAFRKIAGAYGQKRTQNKTAEMPAYEEMLVACRQMESGVGEQRAYEHFGERCGVASYRKLAGILTQNLQKGTRGITVLLEQEAQNAFEERKHAAKRYGEEAGTKLLFPMMLMLGIVMVILLVPAVLAFQI